MTNGTLTAVLRSVSDVPDWEQPKTLLLVDDEPQVCKGLQRILRRDGYRILIADGADEAMELLSRNPVSVVVSDQRMPGKKGTELLSEVQARYPNTVRIILSGAAEIDEVARAMGSGAIYKFLTKPIDPALLRANVSEAFARAAALSPSDGAAERDEIHPATGLPTRARLESIFDGLIDRTQAEGKALCMLMLTVDQHDSVLSSFGYSFEKTFLQAVAQRLSQALSADDILGHDSAGTFLMLCPAGDVARRIMQIDHELDVLLAKPVLVNQRPVSVTLSIGATAAEGNVSFDDIVDKAHAAMITGKERGGATIQLYQPHLVAAFRDQLSLEADLRQAVAKRDFRIYYQPQVHVTSGRIVGLEALLRWPHAQHGFVSPATFIPLAERLGLIGELGAWVLENAVAQLASWDRSGLAPGEMAVNVSARQLRETSFVDHVRAVLDRFGMAPHRLVLEITESTALVQTGAISTCLDRLGGLGVTLAIDDFGTGYANLSNLARFAFQKLKLDRALVPHSREDERARRLYARVVAMADELGLTTVAEGVETSVELALVHKAGCTVVQGYFYSAPLSTYRLTELLSKRLPVR